MRRGERRAFCSKVCWFHFDDTIIKMMSLFFHYPLGVTAQVRSSLFFFRKIKRDPGWSHPGDILFFFSRLEEFYYASSSFFVF